MARKTTSVDEKPREIPAFMADGAARDAPYPEAAAAGPAQAQPAARPAPSGEVVDDVTQVGRKRLAQSLMLEEEGPGGILRLAAILIVAFVAAFLVWASHTKINEVVVSSGEVSPLGSVKRVQYLEGGIIKEIRAKDGDEVGVGLLFHAEDTALGLGRRGRVGLDPGLDGESRERDLAAGGGVLCIALAAGVEGQGIDGDGGRREPIEVVGGQVVVVD